MRESPPAVDAAALLARVPAAWATMKLVCNTAPLTLYCSTASEGTTLGKAKHSSSTEEFRAQRGCCKLPTQSCNVQYATLTEARLSHKLLCDESTGCLLACASVQVCKSMCERVYVCVFVCVYVCAYVCSTACVRVCMCGACVCLNVRLRLCVRVLDFVGTRPCVHSFLECVCAPACVLCLRIALGVRGATDTLHKARKPFAAASIAAAHIIAVHALRALAASSTIISSANNLLVTPRLHKALTVSADLIAPVALLAAVRVCRGEVHIGVLRVLRVHFVPAVQRMVISVLNFRGAF